MDSLKQEVISFKVDRQTAEKIRALPNQSEFIREAVSSALQGRCPLCGGTGVLTPEQRGDWNRFMSNHQIEIDPNGHFTHLACTYEEKTETPVQSR